MKTLTLDVFFLFCKCLNPVLFIFEQFNIRHAMQQIHFQFSSLLVQFYFFLALSHFFVFVGLEPHYDTHLLKCFLATLLGPQGETLISIIQFILTKLISILTTNLIQYQDSCRLRIFYFYFTCKQTRVDLPANFF